MRCCVIFNPAAKGDKARHFLDRLKSARDGVEFVPTKGPGDATKLAAEMVARGHETIVAAGGDGTVNEVANGLLRAGNSRVRLGVLPLGTVNVFAKELGIPTSIDGAWTVLERGRERRLDAGWVEHAVEGVLQRRYFVQLAGAGLDARAVELVTWENKKRYGALAYVMAGWRALGEELAQIRVESDGQQVEGAELVLVGNGKFYGGRWRVFPDAAMDDGLLEVTVFRRLSRFWLPLYGLAALTGGWGIAPGVRRFRARELSLSNVGNAAFELEGDWAGTLPIRIGIEPKAIRVVAP